MTWIILLFATGLVLLAAEIFIPGGIIGVIGGLALLGGVIQAFGEYGPAGGWAAALLACALVAVTLYLELMVLPRSKVGRDLVVGATIEGVSQPPIARPEAVVGKTAEALTLLSPTGYVSIEGQRYEAFSQSGQVMPGTRLRVVGVDQFRIIVTKL